MRSRKAMPAGFKPDIIASMVFPVKEKRPAGAPKALEERRAARHCAGRRFFRHPPRF